ncbi:UDP-glucose 6-dehydrogenase 1 [Aspergillus hancockii]|nr:UDP-glucose 6-dehydrogenase 1 [Aspergillus hancockii]
MWHVSVLGGPLGVMIAYQCPTISVSVVDKDQGRIDAWNSTSLPFYEPGLEEYLATIRQRTIEPSGTQGNCEQQSIVDNSSVFPDSRSNLQFSADVNTAIQEADIIFLCVDTPTKSFGAGKGSAPDLTNVQSAVRTIAQVATSDKIVVEKSTIPCGTSDMLRDLLYACNCHRVRFEVLSNPEFMSEGNAIADLLKPARVLIGSQQTPAGREAAEVLATLYRRWIPSSSILMMDCWSSELAKLAANAMLAQRISNVNSLSAICEATNANVDSVAAACGLDPRIGCHMLQSGIGWGGGCFQKDILDLVYIARGLNLDHIADYWASVIEMNDYQQNRFLRRVVSCMYGSVAGRLVSVLGFAFKENTSDTKNSPAISVVKGLLEEGATVSIYDPMAPSSQILASLRLSDTEFERLRICQSPYDACYNADAIVVATGWEEFKTSGEHLLARPCETTNGTSASLTPPLEKPEALDWTQIVYRMQDPKFVFDGRNVLDAELLTTLGCRYVRVGSASPWDYVGRSNNKTYV